MSRRPGSLPLHRHHRPSPHTRILIRILVEGQSEAKLDPPALHSHVFEDEAQQLLAAVKVQPLDAGEHPLGEVADALGESRLLTQLGVVSDEGEALLVQPAATGVEFTGPAFHLIAVDHRGLVEVGHSAPLGVSALQPAPEPSQLGG